MRYVYGHGQTVRGQFLALKYAPNSRRETYRVAVVVSKKVNKSAVVRNRIRRRIYEAVRLQAGTITGSYDLVFIVFHEQVVDLPVVDLQNMVKTQLQQAGVLDPGKTGRSTPDSHIISSKET